MAKKFDAKAKAKRQKIILAVLGVVFAGVLAWQVPSVLKMMNQKPPAAATAPPPAAPAPGAPVAPATGTPVSATPAAPSGSLADSDPAAQAAGGQLVSFDRFSSKDPFEPQLTRVTTTPKTTSAPKLTKPDESKAPKPPPAPPPSSARISVNGSAENVSVGVTFPEADPMFVLVSLTKTSAKVGISGGSLDSGGGTVTLTKGKKLILENTVDGARYVLVLVSTS
jgi:hypothetical protein